MGADRSHLSLAPRRLEGLCLGVSNVAPRAEGRKAPSKEGTEMVDKQSKGPEETAGVGDNRAPHERACQSAAKWGAREGATRMDQRLR